MKKKHFLTTLLLLALSVPAVAVFKEHDLTQTLRVLLQELQQDYAKVSMFNSTSEQRVQAQHQELVKLVEESNELSIMLYSQPQDNTFDLTYALQQVTRQYEDFNGSRMPFDQIIENMKVELDRYSKLSQTLRNMPPVKINPSMVPQTETVMDSIEVSIDTLLNLPSFALEEGFKMDSITTVYRDSCLAIADAMVEHYLKTIHSIEEDSKYYADTDELLKEAYDYAQSRYDVVQRKVFLEGQRNYPYVLSHADRYYMRAVRDAKAKYGKNAVSNGISDWKGPVVTIYAIAMLLLLGMAILLANILVRLLMRWVKPLQDPYFQAHKGLIITVTGTIIFAAFTLWGNSGDSMFFTMASRMLGEFALMLSAIFLSLLIRLDKEQTWTAVWSYLPTIVLGFLVVFFRTIFVPNSVLNLTFPALVLVFTVWQLVWNILKLKRLPAEDSGLLWLSCAVMAASTFLAWYGLVMMAVLVLIWWFFQLTMLQAITAIYNMMDRRFDHRIKERMVRYRAKHPELPLSGEKGAYIELSWFHDFLEMCVLPLFIIWSIPFSISLACKAFDLSVVANEIFRKSLVNVEGVVSLSLYKILVVASLFFVFRYLSYAVKAFYRVIRTRTMVRKMGDKGLFRETDINFNLANNIISLVCWGIYIIIAFVMLKIPTSALTIVTTGLATGIGFAMKDVLNNFFYGVQLMGGRVRVGDTIECDGIRGKVESLSYLSTQVASEDGSIIAFTNTALFNKNFKNLTRNHQYEMINFTVGVKYGTDVAKAREVIQEALQPLLVKDKYGRDLVDMKKGIAIRLRNFADSSVEIQVLLYAAVEVHYSFAAQAKEAIYNAFNEHGIEIPFPQQDVYIKEAPKE